ncbi:hypothetical protein [Parasulfitobacter algicola]|uniref:Uncharacterized protein n=1 Tax=Parasulfitobacter algicola TaxID=2614809 RepID=A0ABX2IUN7_9RHOB|nr:hypothetical protein [Sulfitobacter algicola]NSX53991.1 hypothetical protein [Sulfitobacter algicola]
MLTVIADAMMVATRNKRHDLSLDYDERRRRREENRKADAEFLRRWNKYTGMW